MLSLSHVGFVSKRNLDVHESSIVVITVSEMSYFKGVRLPLRDEEHN
jgi:hypothetical protein